ncbi:MAG: flavodoxin family protein [Promethearchaeota archaeon]
MKVLMIFFSQTGGTKKITQKIMEGVLNSDNSCEIIQIKRAQSKNLEKYELIGIGTPTFYYREPLNVRNFIQSMDNSEGKHTFLFCTHGSVIGNTFYHMQEEQHLLSNFIRKLCIQ